jgi:hypothetical protein
MSEKLVPREVITAVEGQWEIYRVQYWTRESIQKLAEEQSNVRVEEREDGKLIAIATILQTVEEE